MHIKIIYSKPWLILSCLENNKTHLLLLMAVTELTIQSMMSQQISQHPNTNNTGHAIYNGTNDCYIYIMLVSTNDCRSRSRQVWGMNTVNKRLVGMACHPVVEGWHLRILHTTPHYRLFLAAGTPYCAAMKTFPLCVDGSLWPKL